MKSFNVWLSTCLAAIVMTTPVMAQQSKLNTLPADDETLMRLMTLFSPKVVTAEDSLKLLQLRESLSDKKVVLVGEVHNQFEQHLVQLSLLKGMHEQNPNIGIGVEWIQSIFQPVLDRYLAGEIDDDTFFRHSQFNERWGYDFRMFRPIFSYAKKHGIPVYALSAPQEIVRKVSKKGLEDLRVAEKDMIAPKIHPPAEKSRMLMEEHFTQYVTDFNKVERMIQVKRVWDETMTHNTLQALNKPEIEQMLVFTGVNHIINGTGMVNDLTRSLPRKEVATISIQEKAKVDKSITDYVVLAPLLYVASAR